MIRFRKHLYAFTVDVEEMYQMILFQPSQRHFLRMLRKDGIKVPVQIYLLSAVTYGTADAPLLSYSCSQIIISRLYSKLTFSIISRLKIFLR